MRTFFALALQESDCEAIDSWRSRALPPFSRPVPQANLHITLQFLGDTDDAQLSRLCRLAEEIRLPAFELTLDVLGYWPRQQICALEPGVVPQAALDLADTLRRTAARTGIRTEKRDWRPHVTLARRCSTVPPEPVVAPGITLSFSDFALFESVRMSSGVKYELLKRFDLAVR